MKKTILAIIVVGIVIAAAYFTYVTYVSGDYEDGAPEPKIVIKLTDVSTGQTDSVTIDPPSKINAATAITSTLFAVNPTGLYEVEFDVTYSITPPADLPPGTQLVGNASMSGKNSGAGVFYFHHYTGGADVQVLSTPTAPLIDYGQIAHFVEPNLNFDKAKISGSQAPITGAMLGGSVWTLVCRAQTTYAGTGAYSGTTTVTLNMVLGAENLIVTATGVDVTVTTP
jgi:hypothetical protein